MRKAFTGVVAGAGVVAGLWVIWNMVIPFIVNVIWGPVSHFLG